MSQNVLSLFSGAGGAVEGFKQAGYNVVAAVDYDEDCVATLEENHPTTLAIREDLSETSPSEFSEKYNIPKESIDVVVGGPPCQGFSISGKRNKNDDRNNRVNDFINYVSYYSPETFLMENVTGILSMEDGKVVEKISQNFEEIGYNINVEIHNAANYGVPQNRERALFIGKNGDEINVVEEGGRKSCKDAIDDFPSLSSGEKSDLYPNHLCANHSEKTVEKMKELDYGESLYNGQAYRKLYPNKPAFTMTSNNKAPAVHYEEPRVITVREMAKLQTFPNDYLFHGTKDPRYNQVGNAVPPKMIKKIAEQL